jgi:hypothetical protein
MSASRAGIALPPGGFLVLSPVRGWDNLRAIVRLEGLGHLKKLNDLIVNQIRDCEACGTVPQPLRYSVPRDARYNSFKISAIDGGSAYSMESFLYKPMYKIHVSTSSETWSSVVVSSVCLFLFSLKHLVIPEYTLLFSLLRAYRSF